DTRRITCENLRVVGLNLAQGIFYLSTLRVMIDAAHEAIEADLFTYLNLEGVDLLRDLISRLFQYYDMHLDDAAPENVVSIGATCAFASAVTALLDPGDEVIVFEPYYGYHVNAMLVGQVVPRFVTLDPPDWTIDFDAVEAAITPKTRGIMVNTPSNP